MCLYNVIKNRNVTLSTGCLSAVPSSLMENHTAPQTGFNLVYVLCVCVYVCACMHAKERVYCARMHVLEGEKEREQYTFLMTLFVSSCSRLTIQVRVVDHSEQTALNF